MVAYRLRWRVLLPAVFFPSPLLIAVFRDASDEGWNVSRAITFALLLTIWSGIIAWLISPIRNWRAFQVVLLAIAWLLIGHVISGWARLGGGDAWEPVWLLIVAIAAALILVAALRIREPTEESIRLARSVDERSFGGPRSVWVYIVASLPWIVVGTLVLKSLFGAHDP